MLSYRLPILLTGIAVSVFALSWAPPQKDPWVTPKDAAAVPNPLTASPTTIGEGKTLYSSNCTPCHGNSGRGDGPAAQALTPKPADHTSATVQSETDGSLYWKISQGRNPMPTYKTALSDQQRWELVLYIRTLARTKKK